MCVTELECGKKKVLYLRITACRFIVRLLMLANFLDIRICISDSDFVVHMYLQFNY